MGKLNICTGDILPLIDIIHDCEFDKEKIVFSSIDSTLKIPFYREAWDKKKLLLNFYRLKRWRVPVVEWSLNIHSVNDYQIHEGKEEGPGSDDCFNILEYDSDKNQIWISTFFSKGIEINVDKLEISLKESDLVVDEKSHFTLFRYLSFLITICSAWS